MKLYSRMPYLCTTPGSLTISDLSTEYTGANSILPPTANGSSDRTSTGMLTTGIVSARIAELKRLQVVPNPASSTPEAYTAKIRAFLGKAKEEYCHYESRYKFALDSLFTKIRDSYTRDAQTQQTAIQNLLEHTQRLNLRMNDLIQIIHAITSDMLQTNNGMDDEVSEYSQNLQQHQNRLEEQRKMLSSNEASMKLNKQMVRYTEEKARYTDNLLKLYGFLNVVTLGLLVYVYKAAGDA